MIGISATNASSNFWARPEARAFRCPTKLAFFVKEAGVCTMRGLVDVIENFVRVVGVEETSANEVAQGEKSGNDAEVHCWE